MDALITKPGFDPAAGDSQYHRARQFDPEKCTSTPKTISITSGVKAVVCRTGSDTTSVQTYLFDKDKFSPAEARAWLAEHGKKKDLTVEFIEDNGNRRRFIAKIKSENLEEAPVEKLFNFDEQKLDVFVPFKKIDEENKRVYAYLTTGDLDHDGQRVDMRAVARALPEWLEWGNIREMHQKIVAGVVQPENAKIDDIGLFAGIDVLRDDTWKLIKGGGYKGVSIGLSDVVVRKSADAPNGLLTDGGDNGKPFKIIEASFVDRPANPACKIVAFKALENGDLQVEGVKPSEKLAAPPPQVAPQRTDEGGPSAVAPSVEKDVNTDGSPAFPSFAAEWAGRELAEDLPQMLDSLWSVITRIAYAEGEPSAKKSAMQAAVGEFADMCGNYMTGEKLAKAAAEKKKSLELVDQGIITRSISELSPEFAEQIGKAVKDLENRKIDFSKEIETLKTDLDDKLKEATSMIEKLRGENAELVARVKTIEETPLPPKGIANANAAFLTTKDAAPVADAAKGLMEALNNAAKSADPKIREAAAKAGQEFAFALMRS